MVLTAGSDFPAINQGCVAHHGDIIYEVGGQAHVVGNHPQTCSHRRERGVVGPDNGGVMLRQRRDARIGVVDQTAEPSRPGRTIAAENLATAVKDNSAQAGPAVLAAHYGGGNGQRDVRRRAAPEFQLLGVTEHIDAGTSRRPRPRR